MYNSRDFGSIGSKMLDENLDRFCRREIGLAKATKVKNVVISRDVCTFDPSKGRFFDGSGGRSGQPKNDFWIPPLLLCVLGPLWTVLGRLLGMIFCIFLVWAKRMCMLLGLGTLRHAKLGSG